MGILWDTNKQTHTHKHKHKYKYIYIYIYAEMKLEWLYKAGSESELNSWPDSSVG